MLCTEIFKGINIVKLKLNTTNVKSRFQSLCLDFSHEDPRMQKVTIYAYETTLVELLLLLKLLLSLSN